MIGHSRPCAFSLERVQRCFMRSNTSSSCVLGKKEEEEKKKVKNSNVKAQGPNVACGPAENCFLVFCLKSQQAPFDQIRSFTWINKATSRVKPRKQMF